MFNVRSMYLQNEPYIRPRADADSSDLLLRTGILSACVRVLCALYIISGFLLQKSLRHREMTFQLLVP
jgi:hypothetical protein